jgi:succinyldiaminopimelate transaminase
VTTDRIGRPGRRTGPPSAVDPAPVDPAPVDPAFVDRSPTVPARRPLPTVDPEVSVAAVPVNPALEGLGAYFTETLAPPPPGEAFDFSIGDPEEPTPPFVRQALVDAVEPVSSYPTATGRPGLRRAVADWLARRHGVEVDPDLNVLPSAGSKEAIFHTPLVVVDPGGARRHVLWGAPGYPVYGRGALLAGGMSDPIALRDAEGWRLSLSELAPERLERACLAWLNYPHNPTGATVDVDWFREQLAVARRYGILLASDECYQELWFDEPAPSLLEAADGDLTGLLTFVSLSKRSGMTGYRSGAIIGDPALIGRLRALRPNLGTASPTFVQAAATAAWQDQSHVDRRREVFRAKRRVVLPFLTDAGLQVSGSAATFYVWFRAPGDDDLAYANALRAIGIVVSPGRSFGPGGEGWLRLALVPSVDRCRRAVAVWRDAVDAGRLPG